MKNELKKFIKNSRLKKLLSDPKNFIGSKVEYAHDKNRNIYSINVKLQRGVEYLITLIVGDDSVEMALTDKDGNILEHMLHEKENLVYG